MRARYPFKGNRHLFYKRIEPPDFAFNHVLYALRTQPALRIALLADPDAFAAQHAMDPRGIRALYDNDIAAAVAAGAHPIIGWTVILLLRYDRGDIAAPTHDAGS